MMKEEFEKIVGETVSNEDYNVIEKVYINRYQYCDYTI